jgi:hypothetical protein
MRGGHIGEQLRGNDRSPALITLRRLGDGRSPPVIMLDRFVSVEIYGGKAALIGGLGPSVASFRFETVARRDTRRDYAGSSKKIIG